MQQRPITVALFAALFIAVYISAPNAANGFTRAVYDCSNPDGAGICYLQLAPGDPSYPVQYTPYVFGRQESQPPRGPNPVQGHSFGSTDVDMVYDDLIPDIHQYYLDKFGRNGVNGHGGLGDGNAVPLDEYRVNVNIAGGGCGTFSPSSVNLCREDVTPDIFGHEMNHGVFRSELGYVGFFNEPSTLNESYSDIFGEAFERYETGSNDWVVLDRNLSNPASVGQRDRYLTNWDADPFDMEHKNATVLGHAAYLAAEGGSFNGFDITGIGFNKVEQIFYRAETTYFTSGETFNEAYTHLVQAASDLYGTDDVGQVVKALRAAEINMPRSFNGDFNADGYVDSADYVLWRKGLGTDYSQGLFDIWRAHFSESAPAEATTVTYYIPEPSVAYLVLFAVVPLLCACPCRGLFVRYACSS